MKNIIIAACSILLVSGCKKTNVAPATPYKDQGTLIGYDQKMCPSCGGLEITIKNDTAKNPPPYYQINETLQQLGINPNTKFPVNVALNYQRDSLTYKPGHFIRVTQIKVVN